MSFLNPAFLLALPLAGIPVLIHLLSRRQQKRISWGAMRFLVQAATRRRRLWRLTDLLLLLLRTAAFLFLIFALARPLLPSTWLGGSVPREVILVLDQSMSMGRRHNGLTLLELQAQQAAATLDALTAQDTVRVLLAGESPEWLVPDAVPVTDAARRRIRAQIQAVKPTLGAADLLACLREATDLEAPKDKSERLLWVCTDGQRFLWRLDEAPLWTALEARLGQAPLPTTVLVEVVGADAPEANLCIQRLETARAHSAVGQGLTFVATVANHGPEPSPATLLSWRVEDRDAGVVSIPALAPGASTVATLNHAFTGPGTWEVSGELEARDALDLDNRAQGLLDVHERLPVLVVEDPDALEPLENDAPFILAALGWRDPGVSTGWRSVFEPTVLRPEAIEGTRLADYRAILLADVPSLPPAAVEKLEAYARQGGGVWMALGRQTNPSTFNTQWHRGGLGLSPVRLGQPAGDPQDREKSVALRAASDSHPATALISDFQRLDLDRVRVYRRHALDPSGTRGLSVLIQGPAGEPLVVERKVGRGRVLVQAIPMGVSWSSLPLCQVYVALLHEWLWYLAEPGLPHRNLTPGEPILASDLGTVPAADLLLPDGREVELLAADSADGESFRFAGTRLPGPYALRPRARDASAAPARYRVQGNPLESDLRRLSGADLQRLGAIPGFRVGGELADLAPASDGPPPRHPLEGWFLALLPFLLLAEMALAGWTNRRRVLRAPAVTMNA